MGKGRPAREGCVEGFFGEMKREGVNSTGLGSQRAFKDRPGECHWCSSVLRY
jgi:hypothetical protein